jgi:hypothetical protein
MAPIISPIHIRRSFKPRWSARLPENAFRYSRPKGTDNCRCGYVVTAPSASFHTALLVVNKWLCSQCGERWQTMARYGSNDDVE